ncbi:sialate O-acetylesterase [soil metagenome]
MTPYLHSTILVTATLCALSASRAEVKPMALFSDHAVLQQGVPVPVWGKADAGEKITVSYAGQSQTSTTGTDGHWIVKLDPLKGGVTDKLTIQGNNTVVADDVITGEVWLCSGQSNMAKNVDYAMDAAKEKAEATYPSIRMFTVKPAPNAEPQTDCAGQWVVCSPAAVGNFSATAYYFGRDLFQALKTPVGLINSSVGGTPIQAWMSRTALETLADYDVIQKNPDKGGLGRLYNGMIAPLAPYALRGVVWYQGERNTKAMPDRYTPWLEALVKCWRGDWKQDLPFCWVQLPNFMAPQVNPADDEPWAVMRDSMLRALTIPHSGMAIALGTGEEKNIHPHNKQEVGRCLSLWALAEVYGKKGIASSGPLPASHEIKGHEVTISFSHADGGLKAKDGKVTGFAICGADQKWVWADARIAGDKVIVSSAQVPQPVAVRYAWANNPIFSISNGQGLPASPFRTDNFPLKITAPAPGAKPSKATVPE